MLCPRCRRADRTAASRADGAVQFAATAKYDRRRNITGKGGAKGRCTEITPCPVAVTLPFDIKPLISRNISEISRQPRMGWLGYRGSDVNGQGLPAVPNGTPGIRPGMGVRPPTDRHARPAFQAL